MSNSMIVFPKEEYEARWQKIDDEMKRRGYEVALIWGKGAYTWDRMGDLLWLVNHYRISVLARSHVWLTPSVIVVPLIIYWDRVTLTRDN